MPLSPKSAEYLLLEAAMPGRVPETIGVILHDPEKGRIGIKLRRDWEEVAGDEPEVFEALESDLSRKAGEMDTAEFLRWLEDTQSNCLRISERSPAMMGRFDSTLATLYRKHVPVKVRPFQTHLPVFDIPAAAGSWGRERTVTGEEPDQWVEAPDGLRLSPDMFVTRITGRSMEPRIHDGDLCVFRSGVTGSRSGKLLLVEDRECSAGSADRYTIKRYTSHKRQTEDGWEHAVIVMEPLNPEFEAWELSPDDTRYAVIGEFIRVLE